MKQSLLNKLAKGLNAASEAFAQIQKDLAATPTEKKKPGRPKKVETAPKKAGRPKKEAAAAPKGKVTMVDLMIGVMGSDTVSVGDIAKGLKANGTAPDSKNLESYISSVLSTEVKKGTFKKVDRGQYCVSKRAAKKAAKAAAKAPKAPKAQVAAKAPKAQKAVKAGGKVNKSAWIRSQPATLSAAEVVTKAKGEGITLSVGQVYTARSTGGVKAAKEPKAAAAPKAAKEPKAPKAKKGNLSPMVQAMVEVMGGSTMSASDIAGGLKTAGKAPKSNNLDGYISSILSVELDKGTFEKPSRGQYRVAKGLVTTTAAKTEAAAPAPKLVAVPESVAVSADDVLREAGISIPA